MKVKEIISEVAMLLRLGEIEDETVLEDVSLLSEQAQNEVAKILKCVNLMTVDIATNFIPVKTKEKIEVVDNAFDLTELSKTIFKPISVEKSFHKCLFKQIENQIYLSDGTYDLTYAYIPQKFELEDDIICFGALTLPIFCYGVCSAYSIIGGTYDEAEMWDSKFKSGILNVCRNDREIVMPKRRWL